MATSSSTLPSSAARPRRGLVSLAYGGNGAPATGPAGLPVPGGPGTSGVLGTSTQGQALGQLLQGPSAQQLLQQARSGDPQQAVVDAVSPLLRQIYAAAQAAGARVDTVTLLAAGINVITIVAEMLARAGILQEADIPAFCAAVAQRAVQQHNAQAPQGAESAAGQGDAAGGGDGTHAATIGYGGM